MVYHIIKTAKGFIVSQHCSNGLSYCHAKQVFQGWFPTPTILAHYTPDVDFTSLEDTCKWLSLYGKITPHTEYHVLLLS